jgi:hypothetical protein
MAAGFTNRLWEVSDLVALLEASERGLEFRRDHEPISYWFGMIIGSFAFLVLASGTVFMAFVVCAELFGRLKPK